MATEDLNSQIAQAYTELVEGQKLALAAQQQIAVELKRIAKTLEWLPQAIWDTKY